jgi:RHS repeat-associated protein
MHIPCTFTGREWDSETGLYYFRARFLHAQLGRFCSRDPIEYEGDLNLVEYVRDNPMNRADPTGLFFGFGYGNYCGYSRSPEGRCDSTWRWPGSGRRGAPPIDEVDAACLWHDCCLFSWWKVILYPRRCYCNLSFCSQVRIADCRGNPGCEYAQIKILQACIVIGWM